jgi:hypothetical protein
MGGAVPLLSLYALMAYTGTYLRFTISILAKVIKEDPLSLDWDKNQNVAQ